MKQLTDEQIQAACSGLEDLIDCCRAVIAADRELNNLTGEAQPAREWVGLTGQEVIHCMAAAKCFGTVKMSIERGPYDIDTPTKAAYDFVLAIESKLREKNAGQPAADDKAGREAVGRVVGGNTPGSTPWVRWQCLPYPKDGTLLYTHPQPQAEAVTPDKAQSFYLAVCNFLAWLGREGTVHADDPIIDRLLDALHDIDRGVFKDNLKWPQAEAVRVPDGYALVPVEPTLDMVRSAHAADPLSCDVQCAGDVYPTIYRAMLAAAPKPQEGGAA